MIEQLAQGPMGHGENLNFSSEEDGSHPKPKSACADLMVNSVPFLTSPTMIKYGINNIRDLVGHKVNLQMVYDSPLCRLDAEPRPPPTQEAA